MTKHIIEFFRETSVNASHLYVQNKESHLNTIKPRDPYRLFFPLGILLGLAGVIVWPLLYWGVIQGYWGLSHAYLQADGFLFCFIAGFLLTAVPRFTGTSVPEISVQWVLAITVIAGAILMELQAYEAGQTAFFIAYLILASLAIQRLLRREGALPATFSLVGLGIITGLIASAISAASAFGLLGGGWPLAGKRMLTEGMTLMLVLGVGGFLGPRLLGLDRPPIVQIEGTEPSKRLMDRAPSYVYLIAALIIFISLLQQYVAGIEWMSFVRALIASIILGVTVEPWKFPKVRTTLSWCVWTSNLLLFVSLWMIALFPKYSVDFLHIMFIGSFTLLILAVGMRVSLSHGGHGLSTEKKNWPLRIALIAGCIAMLARVGAPFSPQSYAAHLMYAALLWLIGLGIWGWRLIKLIRTSK